MRSIGAGKDTALIFSSVSLVILTFFYLFVIGSGFLIRIYTFQHRVSYENIFMTHIISLDIDIFVTLSATIAWLYFSFKAKYLRAAIMIFFFVFLVLLLLNMTTMVLGGAVLTLPVVSSMLIIDRLRSRKILKHDVGLSLNHISVVTIGLSSLGIITLIISTLSGMTTFVIEKYPYAIYQELLSNLTPIIMAALVFCAPLKVLINQFISRVSNDNDTLLFSICEVKLDVKLIAICLTLSIILGVVIAFTPHLSTLNPNNERLGVDTQRYVQWLGQLRNQPGYLVYLVFNDIASGDRPLTLVILYIITATIKADASQVLEFSPLVLAPLLVIITFFLTRELTSNDKISIIVSFLATISFQTLIGIYSGFYANWLALIFGYSAFILIVKSLKRPSKIKSIGLLAIMIAVLLAHTHTWTVIILVAFVFLFVLHALKYYPKKHFIVLYLILSSTIAVDVVKSLLVNSSTGLEYDASLARQGLGISQFSERFSTLAETVQTYYGGAYANIAILGLALYWLVRCDVRKIVSIFVLIFISSALVPLFLGDWVMQSRVLYDIPFQIPAAISFYTLWKENHRLVFVALLLVTTYLSLHVLANFGYVPPS